MAREQPVAIVTGAGSGIGRSVSQALLGAGYCVALAGRHIATLDETRRANRETVHRAIAVETDVSDPDSVEALFLRTQQSWGRLDLLFNNAGVFGTPTPVEELSPADWQAVVATNLHGAFYCAQAAFRAMKNQHPRGGRIINNGSLSAHTPRPNQSAYTVTKHAITGLTKALALEGRAFDIACGQIDIGNAATRMTDRISAGALQPDGTMAVEATMEVANAADAVLFMAGLPPAANVLFMTVMATRMPYVGRG